jgi:predicted lipid carrier protein YhbT
MVPIVSNAVYVALRPLPLAPLQPILALLLDAVVRRHPLIFERLGEHAGKRFCLDPIDLPFAFILDLQAGRARITAVRAIPENEPGARIAGPFSALIGLADGRFDGDALFFSRDITVEGDIEAIVALRNAMDDAGVDLVADATACLGPLGPTLGAAAREIAALAGWPAAEVGERKWS